MSGRNTSTRLIFASLVAFVITAALTWTSLLGRAGILSLSALLKTPRETNVTLAGPDDARIWRSITPTKELIWHDCYGSGLQCARLEVPLDYSEPDGRQAAIALVRKPALLSRVPFYRGPVLFNPGGPGGSGVDLVLNAHIPFSIILGPLFDIIGFDPRGVGRSTPRVSLFKSDVDRALFSKGSLTAALNTSSDSTARILQIGELLGGLAGDSNDAGDDYLEHITTPNTARDMLSIVEAHGREKLQYWGFSYGSVLGATFATMFPDRIGRMVIDGVMDAEDYYATGWKTNLHGTDKSMDLFYTECVAAGPSGCALYSPDAGDIKKSVTSLLQRMRKQPIAVKTPESYGIIDYTVVRSAIFVSLYQPFALFPKLAEALAQLMEGNAVPIAELLPTPQFECACDPEDYEFDTVPDGGLAIRCNDGARVEETTESGEKYFEDLSRVSEFADIWAAIRLGCNGWSKSTPAPSFEGPFVANTSHPILIVGNTADPVTPLDSAIKMSKGFKDSVVLTQNSPGHCSIAAPSICTQANIQRYFLTGVLPDEGTVCEPIMAPFPPGRQGDMYEGKWKDNNQSPLEQAPKMPLDASLEDLMTSPEALRVVEELSQTYPLPVYGRLMRLGR